VPAWSIQAGIAHPLPIQPTEAAPSFGSAVASIRKRRQVSAIQSQEKTMRTTIIAATAAALLSTGAYAQTATNSHNPAVKDSSAHKTAAPAQGRNSFTEAQAQGRIAKAGYTGVSKLTKDENGVWQGTAMKSGAKVNVGLDYKGNVAVR
jgi:hypothetical protein